MMGVGDDDLSPDHVQFFSMASPDPNHKGVVGIQNMGNTCYCNSTIQLLRACSEWDAFCLTEPFAEQLKSVSEDNQDKRILLAYQDILKSLWSASLPAYVRPLGFISEVCKAVKGTVYESFGMPVPNDSHEYLVYLLDHFHEALKTTREYIDKPVPPTATEQERMRILATNGWNRYVSKNTSKVVDLFFGMTRKTIHCTNCNNKTYQWEVFNSLKVPCEGQTFLEWIRKEAREQSEIEGYSCDACKGRYTANIQVHLWRLPQNLFITLRRFNYDGRKNMTRCPYEGDVLSMNEFFAPESEAAEQPWNYELRGVSDHHGTHMGGHYTAQFKHPISHQWWWMDDERARLLENPQFSSSNYIFFFKKCN
jgi:ubiquitin C-terminal hydrolase